ncbi:MAG: energy transducer TonB [Methylococcaceae bacterium]|nr:energy transducer TonB [Methylococcaceae bacterium]
MTLFFVETAQRRFSRLPLGLLTPITWRRAFSVAMVVLLACILHCLVLMWYATRPEPLPVTEAKALPMIDIALAAPSTGTPEEAKPLPPKPIPPKPKAKPVIKPKPKPKPVKEKTKSEIKKPIVSEQQPEPAEQAQASPVKDVSRNNPVVGTKADSKAKHSESGKVTQARAFAAYLNNPKPHYPGIARSRNWEGLVLLRVYVTPDGRCGNINVARSSGHDVLDESAVEAVRSWRFVPGKRGDTPIASWVTVPIEFNLR